MESKASDLVEALQRLAPIPDYLESKIAWNGGAKHPYVGGPSVANAQYAADLALVMKAAEATLSAHPQPDGGKK